MGAMARLLKIPVKSREPNLVYGYNPLGFDFPLDRDLVPALIDLCKQYGPAMTPSTGYEIQFTS